MRDRQFLGTAYTMSEQEHHYGPNVHLVADTVLRTLLARLCSPETIQPDVNWLIGRIYESLVNVVINKEFTHQVQTRKTRMESHIPGGSYEVELIEPSTRVVLVDLARAGMLPSMVCFEYFNYVMKPENIRLDHIFIARQVDEHQHVVGSSVSGHKIGGAIEDSGVIFPDPMGATGKSIKKSIDVITTAAKGTPRKLIALHLIITPEYVRYIHTHYPQLVIYGLRLDRGLSDADVLATVPGTYHERERGLNEKDYIVPGAGGLGEVINNSYV